jgi:hypothetical protein
MLVRSVTGDSEYHTKETKWRFEIHGIDLKLAVKLHSFGTCPSPTCYSIAHIAVEATFLIATQEPKSSCMNPLNFV